MSKDNVQDKRSATAIGWWPPVMCEKCGEVHEVPFHLLGVTLPNTYIECKCGRKTLQGPITIKAVRIKKVPV